MMHKYIKNKTDHMYISDIMVGGGGVKSIYFVRHGETEWNVLGKSQGQEANTHINDLGIEQSKKTGKYLNIYRSDPEGFDCMLSSPLIRASETAHIIANEINFDEKKIIFMDELMELKMGQLSGQLSTDDLRKKEKKLRSDALKKMIDPIERYWVDDYKKGEKFYDDLMGDIGVERYDELKELWLN